MPGDRRPTAQRDALKSGLARELIYASAQWDGDPPGEAAPDASPPALAPRDERQLVEIIERLSVTRDGSGAFLPIFDDGEHLGAVWDRLNEELDLAGFIVSVRDDGSYAIECTNAVVSLPRAQFERTVLGIRESGSVPPSRRMPSWR